MTKDYTGTAAQSIREHVNGQGPKGEAPRAKQKQPTINEMMLDLFYGSATHHARAKEDKGAISYYPIDALPSLDEIEQHLEGTLVLGSYTLRPGNVVGWICLDVDSSDLSKARNITTAIVEKLNEAGVEPGVEFSGNKGYHIWIFLEKPVDAARAKAFGVKVREAVGAPTTGDPHVEVFPKQAKLTESSPLGNLVKLPLGRHPKTHKQSVFCKVGYWETEAGEDPLPLLQKRVNFDAIENAIDDNAPINRLTKLLSPYWVAGKRHNLTLYLCGYLATLGWTIEDVRELVESLIAEVNANDPENLRECVNTTYSRLAEGKSVQGFSGLSEELPINVLRVIATIAGQNVANVLTQSIDRARLEKGVAPFLKVRSVTNLAMSYFLEHGRFVKTTGSQELLYWFDDNQHRLLNLDDADWTSQLYQLGINAAEGFSRQVTEAIFQEARGRANLAQVHNKFHWDGNALWVNFGGQEVYILDGKEMHLSYNGADHVLFNSTDAIDSFAGVDLREDPWICPWEYTTKDLNFTKRDNVTQAEAEQQQHMLRAVMLAMCFPELHPTRPIILLLGDRGSGKTTATRRILRFYRGMDEDVLSIVEDKPDSLRASLEGRTLLVLDNVESCQARWLPDILSRVSTGAKIELKKLYKTNETYTFMASAFLMLSAVAVPKIFDTVAAEAVASRLLPIQLDSRMSPTAENMVQQVFADNHRAMWAGMLRYLNLCVASLKAHEADRSHGEKIRLADFANFCYRLRDLPPEILSYRLIERGIENLGSKQNEVMSATSPVLTVLDLMAGERVPSVDLTKWKTAGEWLNALRPIAERNGIGEQWRWKEPAGFSKHLAMITEALRQRYGFETRDVETGKGLDKQGQKLTRKEYRIRI